MRPEGKSKSLSMENSEKKIKLLMIGDSGVGKTSLVSRYVRDKFSETYLSTIGIDFQQKEVNIHGKSVHLQIWDTAGQQRFHTITKAYYRGTQGIIIAFSLENPESFSQLEYWMRQIEEEASPSCVKVLVGTKSDRVESRLVKHDDVARFTERYGVKYIETSAKCGLRVDQAFQTIAEEIIAGMHVAQKVEKTKLTKDTMLEVRLAKKSRC